MKTTAPKRYCVRPNNGIVDGRSTATIHVMLQPFDADASQNSERFKHKFMVQTCFAPDGDVDLDSVVSLSPFLVHLFHVSALLSFEVPFLTSHFLFRCIQWRNANPEAITDSKLRCVFDHINPLEPVAESVPSTDSSAPVADQRTPSSSVSCWEQIPLPFISKYLSSNGVREACQLNDMNF